MGLPAENLPAGEAAVPGEPPITPLFQAGGSRAETAPAGAPADAAAKFTVLPSPADSKVISGLPFRQPSLLSAAQVRRLTLRHEEFARSLTTRFSNSFRLEYGVQLLGLETMFYGKFLEGLPKPVQMALFKLPPLNGVGFLAVAPKFGLAMVDRLCGGTGKVENLNRDLTEIETGLLDQALKLILKEWGQAVAGQAEPNPELIGHETNSRFLPARPAETGTFVLALKASFAEQSETLHFGMPLDMIEPLTRQWPPLTETRSEPAPAAPKPLAWNPQFNSMPVMLSAEWQGMEITARQLAGLKVGDVLPLDAAHINQTRVRIARLTKFTGRLGKCGTCWAVELAEPIQS
jgi:flagellar motor switch protein FliM